MCHEWHIGCSASLQPVSYDPVAAKKLLTEAGYPNGFELSITTWGPSRRIAEAVAGQFRKIGVNAKVDSSTIGVFVQKRADGKIQTQVSLWDNGVAQPDIESTMSFFFCAEFARRDRRSDPRQGGRRRPRRARSEEARGDLSRRVRPRDGGALHDAARADAGDRCARQETCKLLPGHKSPEGIELNYLGWK